MAALGPKMLTDANRRLAFVPTLTDYHLPTATECNAGIDLSLRVTAANFALGATGDASIVEPPLGASNEASAPGRTTYEAAANFFRFINELDDVAWTTFTKKGIAGYLVSRIGQHPEGTKAHEHAFTAGDEVQVYAVLSGTPQIQSPDGAGYEKFRMVFNVQEEVDERAVIAGTV